MAARLVFGAPPNGLTTTFQGAFYGASALDPLWSRIGGSDFDEKH